MMLDSQALRVYDVYGCDQEGLDKEGNDCPAESQPSYYDEY